MERKNIIFNGIPFLPFSAFLLLSVSAAYMDILPRGMAGGFAITMALGYLFDYAGKRTPVVKDYLGGGPLLCILLSSALVSGEIMPAGTKQIIDDFMKEGGFLTFYIASLITGSIMSIETKILVRAGMRYIVPLLAGIFASFALASVLALAFGSGWKQSISHIAMPIMGGGLGAGVIPMSEMFSNSHQLNPEIILSLLIPPMALGNIFSICMAGLFHRLGTLKPALTGNGQLLHDPVREPQTALPAEGTDLQMLAVGLMASCVFLILGKVLCLIIPGIHYYALMIVSVALFKIFNLVPDGIQQACTSWFQFMAANLTAPLLVGIGVTYTDLNLIAGTITFESILTVMAVLTGAVLGAGLGGKLVGFYFIESAMAAGLCMSSMGGTGNVAVLSAGKRMGLMPFAQISSRLGGALILIIFSLSLPFLS